MSRDLARRILQIHPTRTCNLRCPHCYSESAPIWRDALPLAILEAAVSEARREGYAVVSVSGGEPFLYRPLPRLLEHAKDIGMVTTVTTNGTLLTPRRLEELRPSLDLLAVSLDGAPASHDRIRGRRGAFVKLRKGLANVRDANVPFGFIFTLTRFNLGDLPWVAAFARHEGASLLQIHPLEAVGRARTELPEEVPTDEDLAHAWFAALQLQSVGEDIRIQLDVADRRFIARHPERVFAAAPSSQANLADVVSPLVVEADGTVVPITYGFDRRFALGSLRDASLAALARAWRADSLAAFTRHCRNVVRRLSEPAEFPFVNWYTEVAAPAEQPIGRA